MEQKIIEPSAGKHLLKSGLEIARNIDKTVIMFYYSDIEKLNIFDDEEFVLSDVKKIIVLKEDEAEDEPEIREKLQSLGNVVVVPMVNFTRINKIKIAFMMSIASSLLSKDENLVAISGSSGEIDSIIFINISKEKELLSFKGEFKIEESVKPEVFEKVLRIALELANQGREGRPLGAIFVLGDSKNVAEFTKQMIFNPFKGYDNEEKNILLSNLDDTIKEFALLDGAIVIDENGVIVSAGTYISVSVNLEEQLPKGLGSRHISAASITAVTKCISIVVSESTGDVTIFKGGNVITRIQKTT